MIERLLGLISLLCHQHCHPATQKCIPSDKHTHTPLNIRTHGPHILWMVTACSLWEPVNNAALWVNSWPVCVCVCAFAFCMSALLWRYLFFRSNNREANEFLWKSADLPSSQSHHCPPLIPHFKHSFLRQIISVSYLPPHCVSVFSFFTDKLTKYFSNVALLPLLTSTVKSTSR